MAPFITRSDDYEYQPNTSVPLNAGYIAAGLFGFAILCFFGLYIYQCTTGGSPLKRLGAWAGKKPKKNEGTIREGDVERGVEVQPQLAPVTSFGAGRHYGLQPPAPAVLSNRS
ncbi:hypothetical protein P280DRAFT_526850 [Massarina eburnea CBS 473.64]|uniref:Uncharacterized protein n=1 Tax=Massarina eburnea CBS 473.64 TaxID=1395130 RepID=A0A6A6RV31_9PLEO|nr:hypothetical protein P280DRAFT_526850 [Massarina eburnea CBS 473.64]